MRLFAMAALTLAAVATTGCSKDDEHIESTGKVVVSTTTVSLADGTKALNSQGEKTFSTGDEVAVVYENTSGTLVKATVTLAEADISNGGKTASITVSMTDPKTDGDVRIIYPAAMATAAGEVNYAALANQDGKLTTIARSLDLALYEGSLNGSKLPDIPTLDNPLAVCEFQIKNTTGSTDLTPSVTMLYITDGTNSYYLSGLSDLSSIWVVMKPVASGATLTFHAAAGTTRYVKEISGKTLAAGNMYHVAVGTTQLRQGALFGTFSVSGSKKVHFSQGNLQATYDGSSWTWAFAANQYDCIGNATANTAINGNGTVSTNGTVDLFGWSTNVTRFGIHSDTRITEYSGDFVDWGINAISNGGNTANSGWRTLTGGSGAEWQFLFNNRSTTRSYAKATVADKCGVILFPDVYTHPTDLTALQSVNTSTAAYTTNIFDADAWAKMEAAGAVFLPAAGRRDGSSVTVVDTYGAYGHYWSSSPRSDSEYYAYHVLFHSDNVRPAYYDSRDCGFSVRLVCE